MSACQPTVPDKHNFEELKKDCWIFPVITTNSKFYANSSSNSSNVSNSSKVSNSGSNYSNMSNTSSNSSNVSNSGSNSGNVSNRSSISSNVSNIISNTSNVSNSSQTNITEEIKKSLIFPVIITNSNSNSSSSSISSSNKNSSSNVSNSSNTIMSWISRLRIESTSSWYRSIQDRKERRRRSHNLQPKKDCFSTHSKREKTWPKTEKQTTIVSAQK